MEQHRFHSGNPSLLDPKTRSRSPVDEASEPKQSPAVLHVLYHHQLHHRVDFMRHHSLAAM